MDLYPLVSKQHDPRLHSLDTSVHLQLLTAEVLHVGQMHFITGDSSFIPLLIPKFM